MDLLEFLKLGGKISLNRKMGLKEWYSEFTLSYLGNQPFFTGFDYTKYRTNLAIEEALYLFLSVYKHWDNYAFLIDSLNLPQEMDDYDFEYPTPEFTAILKKQRKIAKQEWLQEFSLEKLNSLKKPVVENVEQRLQDLLKDKEYIEYYDQLNSYLIELLDLGVKAMVLLYFEKGENLGSYGIELKNSESSKTQIVNLINNSQLIDSNIRFESISVSLYVDDVRYTYLSNDKSS